MDGVSEDFSGLPQREDREERRAERRDRKLSRHRANPYRGHRTRVILTGGFAVGVLLAILAVIIAFAPTPYLGVKHDALAASIGGDTTSCRPTGSVWTCVDGRDGDPSRYRVKVDWAGCWSGTVTGPAGTRNGAAPIITGCVSLLDHFRAG